MIICNKLLWNWHNIKRLQILKSQKYLQHYIVQRVKVILRGIIKFLKSPTLHKLKSDTLKSVVDFG